MFAPIGGLGTAVIGVASGVSNQTCLPPTVPFHADVAFDHDWIVGASGGDLAPVQCTTLPTALGPNTSTAVAEDSMSTSDGGLLYVVPVGAGLTELRITTNGELVPAQDYDLFVKRGSPPDVFELDFDCGSAGFTTFEACTFPSPARR